MEIIHLFVSLKTLRLITPYEEDNRLVDDFYQPPPPPRRRNRREYIPRGPREHKVDLCHFYVKEDVETYLDGEIKVQQLFAFHQVIQEKKVPLATLSFQGIVMY